MYLHQSDRSQSGPTSCLGFSPSGGLNGADRPQNVNLPCLLIAPHWALWFPGQKRHCLQGEVWKSVLMFFFRMPFAQVYFRRNYPDIAFTSPVATNTSNGQPSALTIFETALWLPGCGACSEGLPLMGLHFVYYSTLRFHSAANPSHTRYWCLDFSLHLCSVISGSNKTADCFIEMSQLRSSYPILRCQPPTAAVYQVLCLKRL